MARLTGAAVLTVMMAVATPAQAGIIDVADVNGYGAFQDTLTGRVWLDLDNFFDQSPNDMAAAAEAGGFTVAVRADVEELLATLPLVGDDGTTWDSYAAVMGQAPNRDLIWGSYGPVIFGNIGWAYSFRTEQTWSFSDQIAAANTVQNEGSDFADMNIWAYQSGLVAVPDSGGSLGLAGIGFTALLTALASFRRFSL